MSIYYSDESVTLYHGDCREVTEWLDADVLVTDPPYGMALAAGMTTYRHGKPIAGVHRSVNGDLDTSARDAALLAWGSRPAIVFGTWRIERPAKVRARLIWHKAGMTSGSMRAPVMTQDEEIYLLGGGFIKTAPPLMSVLTTTEARWLEPGKVGHPTPKPVDLMETLIQRCPPGLVADPFAGSGSTLVAAKRLGREAIGVELEERYCEIIAKRLAQGVLDFGDAS